MSKYYVVEPEVAGGWAENSVIDRTAGEPIVVQKLHYKFDGWLGDEILQSTPFFIVSERLAREIERARLTGVGFDEVEVTTSELFRELQPDVKLPKFVWLKVNGKRGEDDFAEASGLPALVVSDRAFELLKRFGVSHAGTIAPFEG